MEIKFSRNPIWRNEPKFLNDHMEAGVHRRKRRRPRRAPSLSAGIEAVLSAGKDIPVGVCIACIRTPGVAKQALVLPLIGAARQKQCQTDNGKVSFPASQKSYQNKFSHSCAIITPSANERTPHRSFMRPAVRRGPVGGNLCQQIGHFAVAPALFDQPGDPILTGAASRLVQSKAPRSQSKREIIHEQCSCSFTRQ